MHGPRLAVACAAAGLVAATQARGELVFTTSHGIEFSTIGDVGNPVVPQNVGPFYYPPHSGPTPILVGAVDYEFRMARTEVTVEQWAEFITAYRPHYTAGSPNAIRFTGHYIGWSSSQQQYVYSPGAARIANESMEWRVMARFCNWLHNDKASEPWAFESGAYDTSTFGTNPDGTITDQRSRSPGAKFWIPSLDEWTKAMHWDPDRHGPGEGGYWVYPTSSDTPPEWGLPGVGQSSGGGPGGSANFFPVMSYPDVMSPWGLWDGSGGVCEWTESVIVDKYRWARGSRPGISVTGWEPIDMLDPRSPTSTGFGFRLAAAVPAPSSSVVGMAVVVFFTRRRR